MDANPESASRIARSSSFLKLRRGDGARRWERLSKTSTDDHLCAEALRPPAVEDYEALPVLGVVLLTLSRNLRVHLLRHPTSKQDHTRLVEVR